MPAEVADDVGARFGNGRVVLADADDLDPARRGHWRHGGRDRALGLQAREPGELLGFGSGRASDSSTGRPVSSRVHSAISRAGLVWRAHRHAVRGADALELGPGPLFLAEPLDLAERLEVDLGYPAAPTGLESFDKSRSAASLPSCSRRLSD